MRRMMRQLRLLVGMDWVSAVVTVILLVIGVFFVYSACYVSDERPVRALYRRQILWALTGSLCYLGFAAFDYRRLRKFAWWAYWGCIALLIVVLFVGTSISGARRWLMVFGTGVQPSELAKLAVILVLSRKLSRPGETFGDPRSVASVLGLVLLPMLLILKEPDLGTAMVFIPVTFVMMFSAGVPSRVLLVMTVAVLAAATTLFAVLFLPMKLGVGEEGQYRVMRLAGLKPYHRDRITAFLQPGKDPLNAGWNKMQSEIAVGSGGAWGKGFLKGTQNILGFLPRSVAPTDFIYSVIAEETGFAGSLVVLALFGTLITQAVRTSLRAREKLARLFCMGVTALLFSHVFVNIAMTVGMLPITGLPLPLLSYGGSFMVVTMAALGIVQSISIRSRWYEHTL